MALEEISRLIEDEGFDKVLSEINLESEDYGQGAIQEALLYVCENYQLEKILSEIDVGIWKRNFHIEQSEKSNMSLIQIRTLTSIQHMKLLLIG